MLPIEGAYNVRDLGGYKAANDKYVKWRMVFRAGDFNKLTEKDLLYFSQIPIRSYIDFRDSSEINRAPDKAPSSLRKEFNLPIDAGNVLDFGKASPEQASTLLIDLNRRFVTDYQKEYKEFFKILMNKENIPTLFHCSAGKDRTGYAAALFLSSLGVERETIIQDYMLSKRCVDMKYADVVKEYPILEPVLTVKREYIEAAFDVIDKQYGGMENYLTKYLGVDLVKMRKMYTE
jgi:protein-tyrosine phosphatase